MGGAAPSTMFGRDAELTWLQDAVATARTGQPTHVLIEGEAGIGKYRLVAEVTAEPDGTGDLVMVGHGVALSGDEWPFGVVLDALRDGSRRLGIEALRGLAGDSADSLAVLAPRLFGDARGAHDDARGAHDRDRILDAFVALCESLATDRLLCLVVEDLHWADSSSRDLIGYLIRVVGPVKLIVICTSRILEPTTQSATAAFVAELVRLPRVRRLQIQRLGRRDTADLLGHLLGHEPDLLLLDRVVDLAEGIPFLTEQLVAGGLTSTGPVPGSARELMVSRVSELSLDARQLLQVASLAHGTLRHRLLFAVSGLTWEQMAEATVEVTRAHLLVPQAAVHAVDEIDTMDTYQFRHALLREAVADSLMTHERLQWHLRWAEELESGRVPTDMTFARIAAAHHWVEAGEVERAFDAALEAAAMAERVNARAEQAALLTRVLAMWELVPGATARARRQRLEIVAEVLRARAFAGEHMEELTLVESELGRIHGGGDAVYRLWLALRRNDLLVELGRPPAGKPLGDPDEVMGLLFAAPPSRLLVETLSEAAAHLFASPDQAFRMLSRAIEVAEQLDDPVAQVQAGFVMVMHLSLDNRHDEAAALHHYILPLAKECSPGIASQLVSSRVWQLCEEGRLQEAVDMGFEEERRLGRPHLARQLWALLTENLTWGLMELGRWDEASARLTQARSLNVLGDRGMVLEVNAALLACYRGDLETATQCARSADALLFDREDGVWVEMRILTRWPWAEILDSRGDLAALRELLAPVWEFPLLEAATDAVWRLLLVAARAEADQAGRARGRRRSRPADSVAAEHIACLRDAGSRLGVWGDVGVAWTTQLDAELGRFDGRDEPGPWLATVQAWARTGHMHYQAWAMLRLAECHVASAHRDEAVAVLADARKIGQSLRAPRLVSAVVDLARRGRLDVGAAGAADRHEDARAALTARELDVLKLVALGRSDNQIAHELFISSRTVGSHVSHILRKLGVASRSEATTSAHGAHLLQD